MLSCWTHARRATSVRTYGLGTKEYERLRCRASICFGVNERTVHLRAILIGGAVGSPENQGLGWLELVTYAGKVLMQRSYQECLSLPVWQTSTTLTVRPSLRTSSVRVLINLVLSLL